MTAEPRMIADYNCVCGEGPLWHSDEKRLYWTDIPNGRMYRYDPATGHHEMCYEGDPVGGFTIQEDGALLLFMAGCAVKEWREGVLRTVLEGIPGEPTTNRFNDVIADPEGRVFCGSIDDAGGLGRLYCLDTDGTITQLLDGIACTNGMGFTLDHKRMYYTDSLAHEIYQFDYNQTSGAITNQQVFVSVPDDEGIPDGMTVDAEGYVWSGHWDGAVAVRYAPDGSVDRRIHFPANQVSCVTFGGDDYTDMYVTTAGGDDRTTNGPGAGALYCVSAGVRGLPEFRSRIPV